MSKRTPNMRERVQQALQELSEGTRRTGLFTYWITAEAVAKRAGCSTSTARKWLALSIGTAGYRWERINNQIGYRYDPEE